MEKFTKLTGAACPINQSNVNTNQILPARYLKWTRAMGIGKVSVDNIKAIVLDDRALQTNLIGMSFLQRLQKYQVQDGAMLLVQ